jgi:hypothetical protein
LQVFRPKRPITVWAPFQAKHSIHGDLLTACDKILPISRT